MPNFAAFFADSKRRSKLIFAKQGDVEVIKGLAQMDFDVRVNDSAMSTVRNMAGKCLIVTDEGKMRGLDYRLQDSAAHEEKDGIDLLIATSFSTTREKL